MDLKTPTLTDIYVCAYVVMVALHGHMLTQMHLWFSYNCTAINSLPAHTHTSTHKTLQIHMIRNVIVFALLVHINPVVSVQRFENIVCLGFA